VIIYEVHEIWKADILNIRDLSKQIIFDHSLRMLRPYGQPGQMPIGNFVALLIELKAQIL
jgi:hypothetical protein